MATVIVSYHKGLAALYVSRQDQNFTSGAYALDQPIISSETVSTSGSSAASGASPAATKVAHVQVPDGSTVHYVWDGTGTTPTATTSHPRLSGHQTFPIGPGWKIAMIDAS